MSKVTDHCSLFCNLVDMQNENSNPCEIKPSNISFKPRGYGATKSKSPYYHEIISFNLNAGV